MNSIEDRWLDFSKICDKSSMSLADKKSYKHAFYGGALAMYIILMKTLTANPSQKDAVEKNLVIDSLIQELIKFSREEQ